jgi:hypothetical protein
VSGEERTRSLIVRFPDGSKEYRYPKKVLVVGDVIWHDGARFRVLNVGSDGGTDFATVELAEGGVGDLLRSEEGAIHLEEIVAQVTGD